MGILLTLFCACIKRKSATQDEIKEPSPTTPLMRDIDTPGKDGPGGKAVPDYTQQQQQEEQQQQQQQQQQQPPVMDTPTRISSMMPSCHRGLVTSPDEVKYVSLQPMPPRLSGLEETFQKHLEPYNRQQEMFRELRLNLQDLKARFGRPEVTTVADCLRDLDKRCGQARLTARLGPHYVHLTYDRREVRKKCSGPPEDTIDTLELFERINHSVEQLLDTGPQLTKDLRISSAYEEQLRKSARRWSVPPSESDDSELREGLRLCDDNIRKLKELPQRSEALYKRTLGILEEIMEGSREWLQRDGGS